MKSTLLAAAFVLGTLPIVAQAIERTDCVTEEIAGVGFTVCGSDRETLTAFRDRIEVAERRVSGLALTETLRVIACDAQLLEGDLSLLIDQRLAAAAGRTFGNEAQLVAIAESGQPTLLAHLPAYVAYEDGRLSSAAWSRLCF